MQKKVMVGPCDDWEASIAQEGRIIKGITTYKRIPRYDLYDIRKNQQIIPDKKLDDICTSINTSQGCPFNCDFCCSPLMCDKLISKPLELIQKEIDHLKQFNPKFIFIRDENFPLQKDLENRKRMEYDMFYYQWYYYTAEFYQKNIRKFDINDTLHMRFLELKAEFETKRPKVLRKERKIYGKNN